MIYDLKGNEIETYSEEGRINGYEFQAYEVNSCLRAGQMKSKRNHFLYRILDIRLIMDGIRKDWGLKYLQEVD
ncbi:hypothetical protein Ana3638_19660 [Anaerocolumna sedimenticola]|uniref:Uncharacterized protein n=1 Tax=Anaerocolumna sedimenticola TaxID=2696063 RepID=A0A6P1TR41_9FIRM|nr:hypothetical protein [Anaerocolumna sedimenticola]QHQ62719.1 hypothetical protein Ana3638_19660 [Anaerocolumna sedimenticola]